MHKGTGGIEWARIARSCISVPGFFVERFGLDALKFVNSKIGKQLHLRGINAKVVQPGTVRRGDARRLRG